MNKIKFIITAESELRLNNESQMELLAHIRNALLNMKSNYPEIKFSVIKEVTIEDLAEDNELKILKNCVFFEEAQGRNFCLNYEVKSKKCEGICKYFWNKKNIIE